MSNLWWSSNTEDFYFIATPLGWPSRAFVRHSVIQTPLPPRATIGPGVAPTRFPGLVCLWWIILLAYNSIIHISDVAGTPGTRLPLCPPNSGITICWRIMSPWSIRWHSPGSWNRARLRCPAPRPSGALCGARSGSLVCPARLPPICGDSYTTCSQQSHDCPPSCRTPPPRASITALDLQWPTQYTDILKGKESGLTLFSKGWQGIPANSRKTQSILTLFLSITLYFI